MLVILLDNAIKYSPNGSVVKLDGTMRDRKLGLRVVDEGPGIGAVDKTRIFDRFYRVDESRSSLNAGGFGLGLSIASQIAKNLQARITVEDNQPTGSVFTVWL